MTDDRVWEPDSDDPAWRAGWEYIRAVFNSTPVELMYIKMAFWAGVRWQRERQAVVDLVNRQVLGDINGKHADVVRESLLPQIPVPPDSPRFEAPRPQVDPWLMSNNG